ncbi:MAG: hypothetical protein AAF141_16310, partial [Pseudomonadota bacterium]
MLIDGLQYANWSEKIFREMRDGSVDAVHVTITYHETFRETVLDQRCCSPPQNRALDDDKCGELSRCSLRKPD